MTRNDPPALPPCDNDRLTEQLRFVLEVDKVKHILRQTLLTDGSRRENDAEHSWHLALMAPLLAEHAAGPIDVTRVMQMVVVHDLVEIDAGDTFCYDDAGQATKLQRERQAADRIFGLLPADQRDWVRGLWDEFEARQSPEARYAAALDRLQPLMHNYATQGAAWRKHGVRAAQVRDRNRHIAAGGPELWRFVQGLIADAIARGYLAE